MSSDLKVTNIKHESSSSNNLVLGSDGNVGITNTLSAGTIGGNVNFPGPPSAGTFNGGHIIQITTNTSETSASGTGEMLAVSHSITMSDSSHKLLVFAVMSFQVSGGSGNEKYAGARLKTSGTGVTAQTYTQSVSDINGSYGFSIVNTSGFANVILRSKAPINYLFSPAYEGAVTVSAYMTGYASTNGTVKTNPSASPTNGSSTIILMEVVA